MRSSFGQNTPVLKLEKPRLQRKSPLVKLFGSGPSPIVQFKVGQITDSDNLTLALDNPVAAGNALVAFSLFGPTYDVTTPVPTDTQGNTWSAAHSDRYDWVPCWYTIKAKAGATTVTFPAIDDSLYPQWVMVAELSGVQAYDNFNINLDDPPGFESIDIDTFADNDLVLAVFDGTYLGEGGPPTGWTKGDESTELFNDFGTGSFDVVNSILVEWKTAAEAGTATLTATFDDALIRPVSQMAIAFRTGAIVPGMFRIGPLSMDNFVPWNLR